LNVAIVLPVLTKIHAALDQSAMNRTS
jgi:hypothetical protein